MRKRILGETWSVSFSLAADEERELLHALKRIERKWFRKFRQAKTAEIILSDGTKFKFLIKSVKKSSTGIDLELEALGRKKPNS